MRGLKAKALRKLATSHGDGTIAYLDYVPSTYQRVGDGVGMLVKTKGTPRKLDPKCRRFFYKQLKKNLG